MMQILGIKPFNIIQSLDWPLSICKLFEVVTRGIKHKKTLSIVSPCFNLLIPVDTNILRWDGL